MKNIHNLVDVGSRLGAVLYTVSSIVYKINFLLISIKNSYIDLKILSIIIIIIIIIII